LPCLFRPLFRCVLPILLALSGSAVAGPWPREEKGVFLSFSGERDVQGNAYSSLYAEYGLRPRLTLGLELGRSSGGETSAMFWLQRALDRGEGPNRFSAALGMGGLERRGEYLPLAQIAVGWGRGFDSLPVLRRVPRGGWLSVEVRYKIAGAMKDEAEIAELAARGAGLLSYLTPESEAKAELTLGWHAGESLMLIGQVRAEEREDSGFGAKLAVTAVRDLIGPARLELGMIEPLSGPGERAVKLGLWVAF